MKPPVFLSNSFSKFMNNGVDLSAPAHLVDRIVFSNWVVLIGTFINLLGAQANFKNQYNLLLAINVYYQVAFILTWFLNRSRYYLSARLTFLFAIYSGIFFSCAIQGPAFQMEFYLLPFAALAMSLFHPTERFWGWVFGIISFIGFNFFIRQTGPLLDIDPSRGLYTLDDLRTNQINYSLLLILSLVGLSNAYDRAIKLVDQQRTRTFHQNRISNLGLISCNVAHELNSPLAALNLQSFRLQTKLKKEGASIEQIQDTDRILKLSERLSTIVQSFKLMSNSTENEQAQNTTLSHLFKLSTDLTSERLKRYGIDLQIQLQHPQDLIKCQLIAVSQALFCLFDNSIDAICEQPGPRWIRIQSTTSERTLRIHITDSGKRPALEITDKMFEPFFTTKPLGKGIGMGLTIALQTFKSQNWTAFVDTRSENTSFIIEIPAIEPNRTNERHESDV